MKLVTITSALLLTSLGMIFFYAPIEANQGIVQKIFYFHVSSAFTMYIGFFIAFICALFYLLERKDRWDALTVASVEVGFFFCTAVLLTGPIWAKPIWGHWWTWEPRLTTTFLLWLMYAAYLILRGYFGPTSTGKLVTSVVAVIAFLDVPLIHYSVRLWRGIHPRVISSKTGGITTKMEITLAVTFVSLAFLFFVLMRQRYRLEQNRNALNLIRLERSEAS